MHDHAAADDRSLATHRHHRVSQLEMCFAGSVGRQIAHVAFVTLRDAVAGVRMVRRIEMSTGGFAIGRRTIAEFVKVKTVLAGCEPAHIGDNFNFIARLRESDRSLDVVAFCRMENGDGFGGLCGVRRSAGESENGGSHETETRAVCVMLHLPIYTRADELEDRRSCPQSMRPIVTSVGTDDRSVLSSCSWSR